MSRLKPRPIRRQQEQKQEEALWGSFFFRFLLHLRFAKPYSLGGHRKTGRAPMSHDFHITVQEIPDACDLSLCVTVVRRSPDAVRRGDSRW
jgi:hypothetical protein